MPRNAPALLVAPLFGHEVPRLFTPPLVELTDRTSLGPAAITFAEGVCGYRLFPAQKWLLMHLLELRAPYTDRTALRYRTVLVVMARQNSKSTVMKIVSLFMLYVGGARLVLGTAQSLAIAKEVWDGGVELAQSSPELAAEISGVRRANGEQTLTLTNGARWMISATTRSAGRGMSVDTLLLDEIREMRDWDAYGALSKTLMARENGIVIAASNAGDDGSVVMNALRENALAGADPTLGIFEWSAPDGCAVDDPQAWAAANPGLGYTVSESAIRSAMSQDPPAIFRCEVLSQRVTSMSGAVDPGAWSACHDPSARLERSRDRVALCVAAALDNRHVTLVAAAMSGDGRVIVEPVAAWPSPAAARADLQAWLNKIAPAAFGWFPGGHGAVLAADVRSTVAVELKGSAVYEACMGLAEQVAALNVRHAGDPLLTAHLGRAVRVRQGDGWRFGEPVGGAHIDGAYATAGAIHLARTLPPVSERVVHIW